MKLNKDSWHYKLWSSSFDVYEIKPVSTDLCRYCHKVFWQVMGWICFVIMLATLADVIAYCFIYKGLVCNTVPTLIVTGVLLSGVVLVWLYARWLHRGRNPPVNHEPQTLVGKWAHARKQQVCPIVEFTDSKKS